MKKYMIGMLIAAAAFITAAPQRVSAAEAPTQNAILLEKESDTSASVSLRLSNAGEKIASLQFSLHMEEDRKSTRLNSSHYATSTSSRMPSSA